MIEVENLTKNYGPRSAIKNLSFQINRGEVVGFLGPNGAGKSTTMNILSCINPATSGTARVCGYDVFEQSLEVRKLIGYLPETPPLYHDMVVSKFLAFSAGIHGVAKKQIPAAVDRVLEQCMLKDVRHRIIDKLSKGFQQRVGLAQSMIHDPEILILDEPTIGLDPLQIREIRKMIRELRSTHTILLSSHILPEVTQICHRVIILNEGEIAAMDTLDGLNSSLRKASRILLKVKNTNDGIIEKLSSLDKVIKVDKNEDDEFLLECEAGTQPQDSIARMALDQNWGIVDLKTLRMTLEDVFLKLTQEEKEVEE
ncbi:MAG: ABC transporter ATP-binding protein [Nitrospinales bacterium]